jgi:hypothetical protein
MSNAFGDSWWATKTVLAVGTSVVPSSNPINYKRARAAREARAGLELLPSLELETKSGIRERGKRESLDSRIRNAQSHRSIRPKTNAAAWWKAAMQGLHYRASLRVAGDNLSCLAGNNPDQRPRKQNGMQASQVGTKAFSPRREGTSPEGQSQRAPQVQQTSKVKPRECRL